MKRDLTAALLALALTGLTAHVGAQNVASAINPTGTWKLTTSTNVNSSQTLKLKLEAGKLSGTLSRQAGNQVEQLPLLSPKLTGNEISFETHNYAVSYVNKVRQPTDTNKWSHSRFQGAINGDTIIGKVERESFMTGRRTLDFEAKRVR
jgi:hypothetical protein